MYRCFQRVKFSKSSQFNAFLIKGKPRWQSTVNQAAETTGPTENTTESIGTKVWKIIRSKLTFLHFARAARVAFLGIGLYQIGYQAGLITYAQDPHKIEKEMMIGVMTAAGATSYLPVFHPYHIQVKKIGERLIFAAKQMCKEKIESLHQENSSLLKQISENNEMVEKLKKSKQAIAETRKTNFDLFEQINHNKEELAVWETALSRLKGSWHYVVINVPSVNAFVTAACPRRVFVHSGLIEKLQPTDDELALIMGHEISHFLLQHVEKEQTLDAALKVLQLILLTFVEPIGFFSLGYDYLLGKVAQYLDANYSQQCEEEADTLGIELTARACFDTKKSINVFVKLQNVTMQEERLMAGSLPNPLTVDAPAQPTAIPVPSQQEKHQHGKGGEHQHQHKKPVDLEPPKTNTTVAVSEEDIYEIKQHAKWNDSHPSWDDRLDNLKELQSKYNSEKYKTCMSYLRYYIDSISANFDPKEK